MSDSDIEVSVVIPLHNAERHIAELMDSLAAQEWDGAWEVVVADNHSTDAGPAIVETYRGRVPGLQLVEASEGVGSAYTRNVGAAAASGASLLFLDNDDVAGEGYVAIMAEALRERPFVAGRWEVDEINPEWARALRPSGQKTELIMASYYFLPYAAGGTLGIRRELFESVGGFDPDVHYSDCTDLCWRVQLDTPARLELVPEAAVHYRYRESLRALFSQARTWGRAEVGIYKRYRPRGLPPIRWRRSLRRWAFLRHVMLIRSKAGRAWLAFELGNRVGRIEGSVAERTLML